MLCYVSRTTGLIFTIVLFFTYSPVLFWRRCDGLCISGCTDDVRFVHNGQKWATRKGMTQWLNSILKLPPGAARDRGRSMIITTALFLLWIKIHNAKVEFIVCCSNRYSLHFSRLSMNHIQTFTCRSFFMLFQGSILPLCQMMMKSKITLQFAVCFQPYAKAWNHSRFSAFWLILFCIWIISGQRYIKYIFLTFWFSSSFLNLNSGIAEFIPQCRILQLCCCTAENLCRHVKVSRSDQSQDHNSGLDFWEGLVSASVSVFRPDIWVCCVMVLSHLIGALRYGPLGRDLGGWERRRRVIGWSLFALSQSHEECEDCKAREQVWNTYPAFRTLLYTNIVSLNFLDIMQLTRPFSMYTVMYTVTALGHAPDVAHPFNPTHRRRYGP